jgi:hypothetical protein
MLVSWMLVNGFGIVFEGLMASVYLSEIWEFHDNEVPTIEVAIITVFILMTGKRKIKNYFRDGDRV